MIGICVGSYPADEMKDLEERARVVLLSKEFRNLKKRLAGEMEFAAWWASVRERFGSQAGQLLEKVREHVYIMEILYKGGLGDERIQASDNSE